MVGNGLFFLAQLSEVFSLVSDDVNRFGFEMLCPKGPHTNSLIPILTANFTTIFHFQKIAVFFPEKTAHVLTLYMRLLCYC
jgi:hypothetical protein